MLPSFIGAQFSSATILSEVNGNNNTYDKFNIEMLHVNGKGYNSTFGIGEVILDTDSGKEISFIPILEKLENNNEGFINLQLKTISIGWKRDNLILKAGHNIRYAGHSKYQGDLIRLVTLGNGPFVGKQIGVGPDIQYQHYQELFLGGEYKSEGLSAGLNIKLLAGNESVETKSSVINLTTEEEYYALKFNNNYSIQSSSILRYDGLNNVDVNIDRYGFQSFFGDNSGVGVDLFIKLDINEDSRIGVSVRDLGFINWDKGITSYTSDGEFEYTGIDLLDYLSDGENVELADSLYDLLEFEEDIIGGFRSSTPVTWSLLYSNQLSARSMIVGGVGGVKFNNSNVMSLMLGYSYSWSENCTAGITYQLIGKQYANIGIAGRIDYGKIYMTGGINNILGIADVLSTPYNGLSFGIGLNL